MKKIESGDGATDFGVIEQQARDFLDQAKDKPAETLPLENLCHGFGSDSGTTTVGNPPPITKQDLVELIHAEWAGAIDRSFPWWIPSAADKIMARIEGR